MPLIAGENAELTGEEHPERSTMNDDAGNEETSNETGERHRGCSVLRTVNEDEDFIAIHSDLVGHDTDDGMEENKKIKRNQADAKAHQKMYQRQEKSEKTTVHPKNSRRLQRYQQHPRNQIRKEESAHCKD